MSHIVLVNPHWYMAEGNVDDLWLPLPNGLASVAAALRAGGYSVTIVDALGEGYRERESVERGGHNVCRVGLPDEALHERLSKTEACVVGIGNMFTGVFRATEECCAVARDALPSARIVLGGVHPSCVPEQAASVPGVDYVLRGEGEVAFPALIRHLEGPEAMPMPPGVFWKEGGAVINSGPSEIIPDIDVLPMPAYDLLDMSLYRAMASSDLISRGEKGSLTMPIVTSRGCPYGCIFCAAHLLNGRRWRGRSPGKVVDEIELLHRSYGVHSFTVEDSNFSSDESRAIAVCDEIVRRGLKIRWNTPNGLRADRITTRLVEAMKNAGCYEITLAAEHGDEEFLRRVVKKGLALGDIFRAGRTIRQAGMSVSCFLMMGFPGETESQLAKTSALARRLALAGIFPLVFICSPFPGTAVHRAFVENGDLVAESLLPEDYLCSFRVPLMKMPAGIDLLRWRHRTMFQAYTLFVLRHPVCLLRLPAIRKLLASLLSFRDCRRVMKKLRNQFLMRGDRLAQQIGSRDPIHGRRGER